EVLREELRGHDRAVRPRRRVDPAAEELDRARHLLRGALPRAAAEGPGRERRKAVLPRRILRRARADHEVELDEREGGREDDSPHDVAPLFGGDVPSGRPVGTGSRTTTVRCVGTRYFAATRRTSAAVTAFQAASRPNS